MSLGVVLALLGLPGALPANAAPVPARLHPLDMPTPTWSVPIQISNTQASPTGTYQQMVVVNSSRYAAYLNADDSNVEWRYPNGTAIYAWLESNNSNASTRTTWWLKLYNIPARSNQTVYMDVYGETDYLLSVFGPSGEAPQLSATYGGLDDGARVFNTAGSYYTNFSGTLLPSSLGTGDTYTVNNGLKIYSSGAFWGPNCSALRPFTSSIYASGSLGVRSNLTLLNLPSGTSYCFALESWNLAGVSPLAFTQGRTANLSASLGAGSPAISGGALLLVVLILAVALTVAIVALPAVFGERRKSQSKPTRIPAGRSR